MERVVLALDQSMSCSGICIARGDSSGHVDVIHTEGIQTKKIQDDYIFDALIRGEKTANRICELVQLHQVTHIHFESLSLGSQGQSTRSLAIFLGVLIIALARDAKNLQGITHITPNQLKKFATGSGNAKKVQMLDAIEPKDPKLHSLLMNTPISKGKYDIADAYWLGCHFLQSGD